MRRLVTLLGQIDVGAMLKVGLALLLLIGGGQLLLTTVNALDRALMPMAHESLTSTRVYAYRGWQSVGVQLREGERVRIRAAGTWQFMPNEPHGPAGHPIHTAPDFYPLPGASSGALLGRIGDGGAPFEVGAGNSYAWPASEAGTLFLRINDDLLGDNDGWVEVEIELLPAEE